LSLTQQLTEYVHAAFSGIWIVTHEPDEAEREMVQHARDHDWRIAAWDLAGGLRLPNQSAALEVGNDPLAVLRALPTLADPNGTSLLVLHQFHRFLNSPDVIQAVFNHLIAGKQQRTFLVILAPLVQLPPELEKLFVVLDHALPDRLQLEQILNELTSEQPEDRPRGEVLSRVLESAAGLTRYEAEGAFALSLARQGEVRPEVIWELKGQTLRKNNLLTLHRGSESFSTLGGLASLKDFCKRALRSHGKVRPRGVLLLGVPGVGKSAFAKALGNETSRPTLLLDVPALMAGLVGQSEQNLRQALRILDAMSPCIAFVDELEKALSGIGSTGDSGVATRMFGTLLTYLADHDTDVFFVATANDISRLPPEFTRAERFDGCFFLDTPTAKDKDQIWEMYRMEYAIPTSQARPDDTDWTGAEVKSCCRLAALLDVPLTQAARQIVPVAVTAAEQIEKLRTWASGRCLSASEPGIYQRKGCSNASPRRKVNRDASNN
jgi:hypothetical protein